MHSSNTSFHTFVQTYYFFLWAAFEISRGNSKNVRAKRASTQTSQSQIQTRRARHETNRTRSIWRTSSISRWIWTSIWKPGSIWKWTWKSMWKSNSIRTWFGNQFESQTQFEGQATPKNRKPQTKHRTTRNGNRKAAAKNQKLWPETKHQAPKNPKLFKSSRHLDSLSFRRQPQEARNPKTTEHRLQKKENAQHRVQSTHSKTTESPIFHRGWRRWAAIHDEKNSLPNPVAAL